MRRWQEGMGCAAREHLGTDFLEARVRSKHTPLFAPICRSQFFAIKETKGLQNDLKTSAIMYDTSFAPPPFSVSTNPLKKIFSDIFHSCQWRFTYNWFYQNFPEVVEVAVEAFNSSQVGSYVKFMLSINNRYFFTFPRIEKAYKTVRLSATSSPRP